MRLIDADHLRRWILSRVFKTQLSVADIIDQIDREDTIEPDPDTVSRQQAIDAIKKACETSAQDNYGVVICNSIIHLLNVLPPSPSRPHGQWIKAKDLSGEYYYCSECKEELPRVATESATWDNPYPTEYSIDTTDFCPHCGADMRGGAV